MSDQAESLRRNLQSKGKRAKVISIVSGKGGVGKSNIALNLSIALSNYNKKVLLIDLDVGMANLDILMSCNPKHHIVDMIEHRISIWEIIETTDYNLSFIAGGNGLNTLFELTTDKFNYFLSQLEQVIQYFDFIFFDIGAGASKENMQFIVASDEVSVVTTTEPTAITDAYAMIKHISQYKNEMDLYVIVNRFETNNEAIETSNRLVKTVKHFLNKDIQVKGRIPDDPIVSTAVKKQIPILKLAPKSKVSNAIEKLAITYIREGITKKRRQHSVIQTLKQMFTQGWG